MSDLINEVEGKTTTINFHGDIRMMEPWRSMAKGELFMIIGQLKSGLYAIQRLHDGKVFKLPKKNIDFFQRWRKNE